MRRPLVILLFLLPLLLAGTLRAQQAETRAAVVIALGDGSLITSCVDLGPDGVATGEEVLEDAGVAFTADYSNGNAAVCKIGGIGCDYPTEGCFCECTLRPGVPCRYWGYSRLVGDAWRFSALGSSAQTVRGGDVEGWAWGEGSVAQGAVPPVRSFGEICPARAGDPTPGSSPTATASPTASAAASATATAPSLGLGDPLPTETQLAASSSATPTPSPVATQLAASSSATPPPATPSSATPLSPTPSPVATPIPSPTAQQAALLPSLSPTTIPPQTAVQPTPPPSSTPPPAPTPSPVATQQAAVSSATPPPATPPIVTPTSVATPLAAAEALLPTMPPEAPQPAAGLPAPAPAASPTPDYFGYLFFALLVAGLLLARALILRRQP